MALFRPEPARAAGHERAGPRPGANPAARRAEGASASERIGVLLCNLGTPVAATPAAVRRYLAEFLSDRRVVEIAPALWQPILHGVILRRRPAASAKKYQSIWLPEGSPLMVYSGKQAVLLRGYLGERGCDASVRLAMRYGQPSVASALDALKAEGCTRVLVLPLYPQYSGTTTASVIDAVADWTRATRHVPELRFVNRFHDDAGYIRALAKRVQEHWMAQGRPDTLLMSFHGVPQRTVDRGDPYVAQCRETAHLLAAQLGLDKDQWQLSFQSRFGRAQWVGPATQATLEQLGRAGTRRVDVICPGFVSDCLETLEEIAIEGRAAFTAAGGGELQYVPCLNDHPAWITALAALVQRHLQGWQPPPR